MRLIPICVVALTLAACDMADSGSAKAVDPNNLPPLTSREQALIFLKKETFDLPDSTPKGWTVAQYNGLPLGWIKVLPNRMNNYLPPERRIRMEVRGAW